MRLYNFPKYQPAEYNNENQHSQQLKSSFVTSLNSNEKLTLNISEVSFSGGFFSFFLKVVVTIAIIPILGTLCALANRKNHNNPHMGRTDYKNKNED